MANLELRVPIITPVNSPSLRFHEIHRSFGYLKVLSGVSGEGASGESLLVTGSNGSGKSTLLRCLAGLLAQQKGEIHYQEGGRPRVTMERRRRVGFLSPDLSFYEELTAVVQNEPAFESLWYEQQSLGR